MRKSILLLLLVLATISGCAYFNTFYNAKKLFREAREMSLDENGRAKPNAVQKYNKAIKKCGVILTEYKNSRYADDALFLLARCFYYTGTNYIQTIEQINDLIKFYPESEFVPEAYIYKAKAKFRFNKKEEAFSELNDFVNDPNFKDYHPEALQVLADFYLEDSNYVKAQSHLQTIINKYPGSDVFALAFFTSGETYHESGDYQESNAVFFPLLESRVAKKLKLDARYFIILNYLNLNEYNKAYEMSLDLIKKEYRTEKIPRAQILKARCLAGVGKTEEAIDLFLNLIEDNKKTRVSAESSYYLAETYFIQIQDYEKAIEYYNNVKSEYNRSDYLDEAVSRSAVASQIIQYNNPDYSIPVEELVDQQFKLAEFYIDVLAQPDSAISVYDNIINQEIVLIDRLDSLYTALELKQVNPQPENPADSLLIDPDSLLVPRDSLNLPADSLQNELEPDLEGRISRIEENLVKYREEFIPRARFIKVWVYLKMLADRDEALREFDILKDLNPDSKYTYASDMLLQDKPPELISYSHKADKTDYENAVRDLDTDPESSLELLREIAENEQHQYQLKALFSLGYINYYLLADSLEAKKNLDHLITIDKENIYRQSVSRFYDGSNFITTEKLEVKLETLEPVKSQEDLTVQNVDETETFMKDIEETGETLIDTLESVKVEEPAKEIEDRQVGILEKTEIRLPEEESGNVGNMFVRLYINREGLLDSLKILNPASLDSTSVNLKLEEQIRKWQFTPALKQGTAEDASLNVPIKIEYE